MNVATTVPAQAFLFDMDGTLVDSSAPIQRVWTVWAQKNDLDIAHILNVCQGRRSIDTVRDTAPHLDADAEAAWLLDAEVNDTDGVVCIPGADKLLAALPKDRWGVVTSASRRLAEARLRAANLPIPEMMVTSELVQRGKPDPQGFLLGAQKLGVSPELCLVFEDTPAGLNAGRAANMSLLGLSTTFERSILPCTHTVSDYRQVRVCTGPLSVLIS